MAQKYPLDYRQVRDPTQRNRQASCRTAGYFGGSDKANSSPRPTQLARSASDEMPSTPTTTNPRIGLPVKSITRVCGSCSASSYRSAPTRTISSSPSTPPSILPCAMKQSPPNILRSTMPSCFPSDCRIRSASSSLYANLPLACAYCAVTRGMKWRCRCISVMLD